MNALALTGLESVGVTIQSSAYALRQAAIEAAGIIGAVRNPESQAAALGALKALKAIEKSVEASRKEVKAPVLAASRLIDSTADEFVRDVEAESKRLQELLTGYELEQRRIAQEAEAKRQAEIHKAEESERKRQAELRRQQDEAERIARESRDAAVRAEAEAKSKDLEAQRQREQEAARVRAAAAPVAVVAPKPQGQTVRDRWTFEVVNTADLYKAAPQFCIIVPQTASINAAIAAGLREIPGLKIFNETKVSVR